MKTVIKMIDVCVGVLSYVFGVVLATSTLHAPLDPVVRIATVLLIFNGISLTVRVNHR